MPSRFKLLFILYCFILLFIAYQYGSIFDYRGFYETRWSLAWQDTPYSAEDSENTYPPAFFFLTIFWKLHPLLPKLLFVLSGLLVQWICLRQYYKLHQSYSPSNRKFWLTSILFPIHFFLFTVLLGCADTWLLLLITLALLAISQQKSVLSGLLISLAGMTKFYPFFLLPVFLNKSAERKKFLTGFLLGLFSIVILASIFWRSTWLLFFTTALNYEAELASLPASIEQTFQIKGRWQYFYHAFFLAHFLIAALVIRLKKMDPFFGSFFLITVVFSTFTMGHIQFFVVPLFLLLISIGRIPAEYWNTNKFLILFYAFWLNLLSVWYFSDFLEEPWSPSHFFQIRIRDFVGTAQYFITLIIFSRLAISYPSGVTKKMDS